MFDPMINGTQREISLENGWHAVGADAFLKFNYFGPKCFYIPVWQYIYRRKFINDNNLRFYSGLIHEDELWTRCSLVCAKSVIYCKKTGYYYENRPDSITTRSLNIAKSKAYIRIAVEIDKFRRNYHVVNKINEVLITAESKFIIMAVELVSEKIFNINQLDDLINKNIWDNIFNIDIYCCSLCQKLVQSNGKSRDNLIMQIFQSEISFKFFNEWKPRSNYEQKIKKGILNKNKNVIYKACKLENFKQKLNKYISIMQ
ncbi:hypothetical protein BHF70_05875 [Anaerostipes sp. 494a]|uniref:hypothetical protein n=1 Tax=Anaerostipes sp. 494a TaxID=1261636 RepID=UPI000951A704|nr:hypothetical protein [Anaerostipes sp. 494a]OLR59192.1 hypothetical protein BHF70_05875 [Anaerostipes sp. 494a]